MKLKILIASLVLGLSSAAAMADTYQPAQPAQPAQSYHVDRDGDRDGQREGREHRVWQEWTTLASSQKLSGKETIRVRSGQEFSKLEIQATKGSTFVDKVMITFGNGQTQMVHLDKNVSLGQPAMIDLSGNLRKISKVTVLGNSGKRAAISILAV